MSSTMSVTEQVRSVQKSAEHINASKPQRIETASIGDNFRQGDMYFVKLAKAPTKLKAGESVQLAPGTTQGSRHTVSSLDFVRTPESRSEVVDLIKQACGVTVPEELVGPILLVPSDTECPVMHPEHGDKIVCEESVWATVYQRQLAEEVRRIND